ncbi:MAG: mechanosensitive ion channel [Bacteroidales bacterium]|nr:mechanosensitive ion channel [Bacteroidales bacterium]
METLIDQLRAFIELTIFETKNFTLTVSSILIALIIIILTAIAIKLIKRIMKGLVSKNVFDEGTSHSLFQMIKYVIWTIIFVLLIDSMGFKVSILIASAAALLVGVGLGLQQLFMDVASGIILLIERTVKINDVVELENEMIGRVVSIGLRTSKIKTRDNIITIIPNSNLVNDRVINWSHAEEKTRFHVDVGVKYGSDIELVTSVLLECAKDHTRIMVVPKPFVRFVDFGESSLDFQLFFWTNDSFMVENTKSDLRYKIDRAFRENKIEIPFPQRDLYLKSMPDQK